MSEQANKILSQINENTLLGDIRKIAKEIKKDHDLALELWATGEHLPRLLAILIMDKKQLTEEDVNQLTADIEKHSPEEQNQLMDWLFSNQLAKGKKLVALIESWQESPYALQRRIFWYYQGRLRWRGKTDHDNTADLLEAIEANIEEEDPEVQWAMNFTAGWIGVFDTTYRESVIDLGERTGLYKGDMVSKGCTPNYLPEFVAMEAGKRDL